MRRLIPDFILNNAAENNYNGSFNGFVLNIDLIGLTPITQSLMEQTPHNVDILVKMLPDLYTPTFESIESRGGFIATISGESITAIFPEEVEAEAVITAAMNIRDFFINLSYQKSKENDNPIAVKIGLAKGIISWEIWKSDHRAVYCFAGDANDGASEAKNKAEPNQIVLASNVLQLLDSTSYQEFILDENYCVLEKAVVTDKLKKTIKRSKLSQKEHIPEDILAIKSAGSFNNLVSCYVCLDSVEYQHITNILVLCEEYNAFFYQADCSDKGWLASVYFLEDNTNVSPAVRAIKFAEKLKLFAKHNVCIGLTLGKIFAGFVGSKERSGYTCIGMSVDLARTFCDKAAWGDILFDRNIFDETMHLTVSKDLGLMTYEGFVSPIPTLELLSLKEEGDESMFLSQFVGRTEELNRLIDSCAPIFQNRFAGVTYIYGEGGQGKSRTVLELRNVLDNKADFYLLQCDSVLMKPLNPFVGWINTLFDEPIEGTMSSKRFTFRKNWSDFTDKVRELADTENIVTELERIESIIAGLLGLEWEGSIFASLGTQYRLSVIGFALKTLLEAICLFKPVVLVVEDLQSIDKQSEEVLIILTRRASAIPYKIILTSRPYHDDSLPVLRLDKEVEINEIKLSGLSQGEVTELMSNILGKNVSADLMKYVYLISLGNPFVVEQLTLFLKESAQLQEKNGEYDLIDDNTVIPVEGQALIVARLDRLDEELKQTVQVASVLGNEFSVDILSRMLTKVKNLPAHLISFIVKSQLYAGEQEHLWYALSDGKYSFSHSLLRDAAYQMQNQKKLKEQHLLAAHIMDEHFSEDKSEFSNIAAQYNKAGDWQKAVAYFIKAGIHEKETFQFNESLELFNAAYELNSKQLGEQDPITAKLINLIGTVYFSKGDYDKALEYYEKAYAIREKLFGDEHADTAATIHNIGLAKSLKGDFDFALKYFEQAFSIRAKVLGENHIETTNSLNNIGSVHYDKKDFDKALDYYKKVLAIRTKSLGLENKLTASCIHNIASVYYHKGDTDKSLEFFKQALDMRKRLLGTSDPETASTLNNIGVVYLNKGELDKTIDCFEQALAILQKILGDKHPQTAISLNNLGIIYRDRKKQYDKSLDYLERALAIRTEKLSDKSPEVPNTLDNIAILYTYTGDYDKALEYYRKALSLRRDIYGDEHINVAKSLAGIGNIYMLKKDFTKALDYLLASYNNYVEKYGNDCRSTQELSNKIADVYEKMERDDLAARYRINKSNDESNSSNIEST